MSSFKNFAPMLSNLQRQADGRGTLEGSSIDEFLSIAGYEPEGSGGGGDLTTIEPVLTVTNTFEAVTSVCNDDGFIVPQANNTVIMTADLSPNTTFNALYRYSSDTDAYYACEISTETADASDLVNCTFSDGVIVITDPTQNASITLNPASA